MELTGSGRLGGQLELEFTGNFESQVLLTDTFVLMSSPSGFSGAFTDVANGQRLFAEDGVYSFIVNYGAASPYGADEVVLTDAVPEPEVWVMLAAGSAFLAFTKRRFGKTYWTNLSLPGAVTTPAACPGVRNSWIARRPISR